MCCQLIYIGRHRFVDVPAGVTQEEDHSGFLPLTSAVLALVFLARRIQKPFLSLVDREVEYCLLINPSTLVGHIWAHKHIYIYIYIYWRGEIPACVTAPRFELTSQRHIPVVHV